MRVLRIYHSGVVTAYRQRDRELRRLGIQLTLATARRWNEGGNDVTIDEGKDDFVVSIRTFGRHPYLFVYGPLGLWRLLHQMDFDVIDAHEEPASVAAFEVMVLRRLLQPKSQLLFYSAQNLQKRYPIPFRWIEWAALKSASAVHCCNQAAADILRSKGFTGYLSVLGLGVDIACFHSASISPTPGPLRVGFVGRIEHRKGIWVLLAAVAAVAGTRLEFVGDGPDRQRLQREILRLGLGTRVRVQGYTPHDDLPSIFRSLDVLCVPSLPTPSWIEQFGRVAVEAMASGVPVLASDVGALPEVVGDAGMLLPPGDSEALAAALRTLIDQPELRSRMSTRGQDRARQYSWDTIAAAQCRVYLEVLA